MKFEVDEDYQTRDGKRVRVFAVGVTGASNGRTLWGVKFHNIEGRDACQCLYRLIRLAEDTFMCLREGNTVAEFGSHHLFGPYLPGTIQFLPEARGA